MDDRNAAIARESEAPSSGRGNADRGREPDGNARKPRSARQLVFLIVLPFAVELLVWGLILRYIRPDPILIRDRLRAGQFEEAARLARRYLVDNPNETMGLLALGKALAGARDYAGLAETLAKIPDRSTHKVEADDLAATALLQLHRSREAEVYFRDVIKRSPKGYRSHALNARRQLLRIYGLEGRKEAFVDLVRETVAVVPKFDRRAYLAMRMRLEFERAVPEADRRVLEPFVKADPEDANALAGLASLALVEGNLLDTETFFMKALTLAPDDPELRERALDVVIREPDSSAELKRLLARRAPGSASRPRTAYFLGILAETGGDFETARRHYARACQADPSRYEYPYKLSRVLRRLGRLDEAKARELDRDRIQKARTSLREAWEVFAEAFETGPSRVEPAMLLNLALACERIGWLADARDWYRETLLDAPDDKQARAGFERLREAAAPAPTKPAESSRPG